MTIYYDGKPCRKCNNTKRYKSTRTCIVCAKVYNGKTQYKSRRKYALKKKYNITLEEYNSMAHSQENKCAICGDISGKLCVDHDHKTGEVRGLLCTNCNTSLGKFKDSIEILKNAISYLTPKSK
jgi:hypothetical protein